MILETDLPEFIIDMGAQESPRHRPRGGRVSLQEGNSFIVNSAYVAISRVRVSIELRIALVPNGVSLDMFADDAAVAASADASVHATDSASS